MGKNAGRADKTRHTTLLDARAILRDRFDDQIRSVCRMHGRIGCSCDQSLTISLVCS